MKIYYEILDLSAFGTDIIYRGDDTWRRVHKIKFASKEFGKNLEVQKWCFNTFGPAGLKFDTMEIRWIDRCVDNQVVFKNESDVSMFMLKWATA